MGLRDAMRRHQFDASFAGYAIRGDRLVKGLTGRWELAGSHAEFEHGAQQSGRVTATRVALTGPFALLLKKDRNKVYIAVETPDGDVLIEASAKDETAARKFAARINQAAEYFANVPRGAS